VAVLCCLNIVSLLRRTTMKWMTFIMGLSLFCQTTAWAGPDSDPGDQVMSVAYSHDAKTLLAAEGHLLGSPGHSFESRRCDIRFCDPVTGQIRQLFATIESRVTQIVFSPDDTQVACATHFNGLEFRAIKTGQGIKVNEKLGKVYCVAFDADGSWACGYDDGWVEVHVINGTKGQWHATDPAAKDHPVVAIAFIKRNNTREIATGSDHPGEGFVRFWNAATGAPDGSLAGANEYITTIAVNSDATRLASGGPHGGVDLFDVASSKLLWTKSGNLSDGDSFGLAFQRDSVRVAAAPSIDGKNTNPVPDIALMLVEGGDGKIAATVSGHKGGNRSISFSDDHIASGGDDGHVPHVHQIPR
jgi:WD40 repeat protein